VGIYIYQNPVVIFEHSDSTLPGPTTFLETAGHHWRWAQEKVLIMNAFPGFFIENNIVLPKGRSRASPTNKVKFRQDIFEKICLEIVCFLKTDKVYAVVFEKTGKAFFPVIPTVGAIICQAKTQIEC
jgi:hypothetical protein